MPATPRTAAGFGPIVPADLPLLTALSRYCYLTAAQLTRLRYAPGSQAYVQARLKRLADAGVLQRFFLPRPSRTGSAPLVYSLARRGLHLLRAWGQPALRRSRPAEVRDLSYLHLVHTLAVNDVLITVERACRATPLLALAEVRHERVLKSTPVPVVLPSGQRTAVIPDAWLDLRLAGRYQECYCLEVDRGTMGQRAWRRKVAALVAFARGPYQRAFGTTSLTIAVVATPGEGRGAQLLRWTEAELSSQGSLAEAALFRFTALPAAGTRPEHFVHGAHWSTPGRPHRGPLIARSDIAALSESAYPTERSENSESSENSVQEEVRVG